MPTLGTPSLLSVTQVVPDAVPSLFQSWSPWVRSSAVK